MKIVNVVILSLGLALPAIGVAQAPPSGDSVTDAVSVDCGDCNLPVDANHPLTKNENQELFRAGSETKTIFGDNAELGGPVGTPSSTK